MESEYQDCSRDDIYKVGGGILESQSDPGSRAKDCFITGEDTENVKTEEVRPLQRPHSTLFRKYERRTKMYMELEFADKIDLKALGISVKEIKEDIDLLQKWGFDFNRNIISYIHQMAESIRYVETKE